MLRNKMDSRNLGIETIFLIENTVGILGNVSLLLLSYHKKHRLKPLDLILIHLIKVNLLIILTNGVGYTMTAFWMKHFFNAWSYQLFMYVQRVFRSMSIATICILRIFQFNIIRPRNSCSKNIQGCWSLNFICWDLCNMKNVLFPLYISIKLRRKSVTKETEFLKIFLRDRFWTLYCCRS